MHKEIIYTIINKDMEISLMNMQSERRNMGERDKRQQDWLQQDVWERLGTPAYVFDLDCLEERIRMIRAHLGKQIRLVYAMKANPFLVEPLIGLVDGFEVCSPGEERICARVGVPGEMLVLSGVNKEEENFADLMDRYRDLPLYTAESAAQVRMLDRLARERDLTVRTLLRVSDGNQFGMDESVLRDVVQNRTAYPGLHLEGIQLFTGTQKKPRRISKEIDRLDAILCDLRSRCGPGILDEAEYGPGLAVSYFEDDPPRPEDEALDALREKLENMRFDGHITLEMGRFIAAPCGSYLTKIVDVKENDGTNYVIVDGGIHQVNYYGQNMAMKIPSIRICQNHICRDEAARAGAKADSQETAGTAVQETAGTAAQETAGTAAQEAAGTAVQGPAGPAASEGDLPRVTICGSLCTTADVLVREFSAGGLQPGDVLVFEKTGAYAVTEGISLFLSRDLPRVWLYAQGKWTLIREKYMTEELNCGYLTGDTGRDKT